MSTLPRRVFAGGVLPSMLAASAFAGTITVTNTDDSGPGSLRQAVLDANADQPSTIVFQIGSGHQRIRPLTALPMLIGGTIDGATQPGYAGAPIIEIDGSLMPAFSTCLSVRWGWIEALVINRCSWAGVSLDIGGGVRGSYIGTDETGTIARPNGRGVSVSNPYTTVGGAHPGEGNVISGNVTGISIFTSNSYVMGNRIGTDPSGMASVPNRDGIEGYATQIGGPTPWHGNLISGNTQFGIRVAVNDATGTVIENNAIGPDAGGGGTLTTQRAGIMLSSTTGIEVRDNVVAHHWEVGIGLEGVSVRDRLSRNRIFGNAFGVDLDYESVSVDRRTPNDPADEDYGTNLLQNFPLIATATVSGGLLTVRGSLNSEPDAVYDVEVFATKPGAGQIFVGTVPVTTDSSGDGTFAATLAANAAAGDALVATATDVYGDTSEISDPASIVESPVQVVSLSPDSGPAAGGTPVTLAGAAFQPDAAVAFGDTPAAAVTVTDPAEILATTPALAPGTVPSVVVENGDLSTGGIAHGWFADFLDVAQADAFHAEIESLVRGGVTSGCGGGNYCPLASVTRAQMSVFLLRAKLGPAYLPPPATFTAFADVVWNTFAADWIEDLAARGITGGCGGGNYCPQSPVSRQQMAVFLLKAEHGSDYVPPPCSGTFTDVPCPSPFADWIEQLAAENVTGGCGGGNYCPGNPNTRGQMAVFLVKTFSLQ